MRLNEISVNDNELLLDTLRDAIALEVSHIYNTIYDMSDGGKNSYN